MSGRSDGLLHVATAGRADKIYVDKSNQKIIPLIRESSTVSSSNGIVVFDNQSTTVEVTVKTKGKKPPTASISPMQVKPHVVKIEKDVSDKKRSNGESWSRILREQNQAVLKQSVQKLSSRISNTKIKTEASENREIRRPVDPRKSSKYNSLSNEVVNNLASKQSSTASKRSSSQSKIAVPPAVSFSSGTESIIVVDKGIQCGGVFDKVHNSFGLLNPVRAIGVLLKELEGFVNDERVSKIVTQMEQALLRIPLEQGHPSPADLQTIADKAKLEASAAKLAATSRIMEESHKNVRKENALLQQHVEELSILINQVKRRETELELEVKQLKMELNEVSKVDLTNRKVIDDLREENKQIETLKKELKEVEELARQKHLELQCLKIENEKLTIMTSYKDSQLIELRNAIKNLQHNIADQLVSFKGFPKDDEIDCDRGENHSALIRSGNGCSSPAQSSSNNSIARLSWQDISDVSSSSVNDAENADELSRKTLPKHSTISCDQLGNSETKFREKTHLDFVSLACEDVPPPTLTSTANDRDLKNINIFKKVKKEDYKQQLRRQRSSKRPDKNHSDEKTLLAPENEKYQRVSSSSSDNSIDKNMKEIQTIFRKKSGPSIDVPSPPRNFPRPDWSDSTLQTLSMSESNVV